MKADVIVRAKVDVSSDDFDPEVFAREVKEKGLPPDAVIGHVMVIADDGSDGVAE